MKNIDDTGLCLACCRHCVLITAINMKRGEVFAYPLFIQAMLRRSMNINYFCQDVVCKYYPYLKDVVIKSGADHSPLKPLEDNKPFLSVMHGKTHDLLCQVMQLSFKLLLRPPPGVHIYRTMLSKILALIRNTSQCRSFPIPDPAFIGIDRN